MDEARILIKAPDLPSDKIKCIYKNSFIKQSSMYFSSICIRQNKENRG